MGKVMVLRKDERKIGRRDTPKNQISPASHERVRAHWPASIVAEEDALLFVFIS